MNGKVKTIILCILAAVCLVCSAIAIAALISHQKSQGIYGEMQSKIESILYPDETESQNIIWTRGEEETPGEPEGSETTAPVEPETSADSSTVDGDATTEESVAEPTDTDPVTPSEPKETDPVTPEETEPETKKETTAETEKVTEPESESETRPQYTDLEPTTGISEMRNYILELQKVNPDIMGVIHIPIIHRGVRRDITYAFAYRKDNEYYLDHNIYGEIAREGAIFADGNNSKNVGANQNLVLYGHNMYTGTMFHNLTYLLYEDAFYSSNIFIYTTEACYKYEIISAYTTDATSGYAQLTFGNAFTIVDFIDEIVSNSKFEPDISKFSTSDRLITLSTCYSFEPGRLAVHGVLIQITN